MEKSQTAEVDPDIEIAPVEERRTDERTGPVTRTLPPHAVVLHNDSINGIDFVVRSLRKVFHFGWLKASRLTLQAHFSGRAIVWSGAKEHAELKAEQVRSCGPDPFMKRKGALPLRTTVEALPG
jgi:ATP-dependent Clp protease adaptor protein ClpS